MERKIKSCEFNLDTNCVEVEFSDGTMLVINCEAVEDVYDIGVFERSELDWLIYNNPLEYAYHVLNGSVRDYLKGNHEHQLMD
ncbi:MAG: hypothetical protein IJK58_05835 [Clostridia bacterium]|nr:hypothetical protein [Oscillospiraceae bacterium]MBQ6263018.1 hypothetical protein [Clostridia bacterium]